MKSKDTQIEIRTGSSSDVPKIQACMNTLGDLGLEYSQRILSAHRTPERMAIEARNLETNGFRVCIAAAGGSAHLPGMTASETLVPVIGIPVLSSVFDGIDSLLSIAQMPEGIPVACVGIGNAEGAAIAATKMLALGNSDLHDLLREKLKLGESSSSPSPDSKLSLNIFLSSSIKPEIDIEAMVGLSNQLGIEANIIEGLTVSASVAQNLSIAYFNLDSDAEITAARLISDNMLTPTILSPIGTQNAPDKSLRALNTTLMPGKTLETSAYLTSGVNRPKNAILLSASTLLSNQQKTDLSKLDKFRKELAEAVILEDQKLIGAYVKP